jgi:SAM-dependent methyltransferase
MTGTFGPTYADAYDALYADKDYEAECDLIESLAAQHGRGSDTILDLGCGTGRHAVILAGRGREVTGVDLSAEMLKIARRRADEAGVSGLDLQTGDVRTFRIDRRYDVALLMFAVLGYQLADEDVASTLETAALHLRPGGVLILDVWHGPAVEALGPTVRTKLVPHGQRVIRRRAHGKLDPATRTCLVSYTIEDLVDDRVVRTDREQHRMRYFFQDELAEMASRAGFRIATSAAFPEVARPAGPTDWNAVYVLALEGGRPAGS